MAGQGTLETLSEASAEARKEEEAENAEIERMAQSAASSDKLISEPIVHNAGVLEHDYWLVWEGVGILLRTILMWYIGLEVNARFAKYPGEPYSSYEHNRTAYYFYFFHVHDRLFDSFYLRMGTLYAG